MDWVPGRQGGGYLKKPLFRLRSIDCYLIKYPTGTGVRLHKDPVPGRRHFRLNVVLRRPVRGGQFRLIGWPILSFWRITLFRPDQFSHAVEEVLEGERLVFSIGAALRR